MKFDKRDIKPANGVGLSSEMDLIGEMLTSPEKLAYPLSPDYPRPSRQSPRSEYAEEMILKDLSWARSPKISSIANTPTPEKTTVVARSRVHRLFPIPPHATVSIPIRGLKELHLDFLRWEAAMEESESTLHPALLSDYILDEELRTLSRHYYDKSRGYRMLKPRPDIDSELLYLKRALVICEWTGDRTLTPLVKKKRIILPYERTDTILIENKKKYILRDNYKIVFVGNIVTRVAQILATEKGDMSQAIPFFERAIELQDNKDRLGVAASSYLYGRALVKWANQEQAFSSEVDSKWERRTMDALVYLHDARRIRTVDLGEHDMRTGVVHLSIAQAYEFLNRLPRAIFHHEKNLAICKSKMGAKHEYTRSAEAMLADALERRGKVVMDMYKGTTAPARWKLLREALEAEDAEDKGAMEVELSQYGRDGPHIFMVTLEGALSCFRHCCIIRTSCFGPDDVKTRGAQIAANECIQAIKNRRSDEQIQANRTQRSRVHGPSDATTISAGHHGSGLNTSIKPSDVGPAIAAVPHVRSPQRAKLNSRAGHRESWLTAWDDESHRMERPSPKKKVHFQPVA